MGRGRAKAKQTKVARRLKYGGPQTDLERLQAELAGTREDHDHDLEDVATPDDDDDENYDEIYAKYLEDPEGDDEDVRSN